MFGGKVFKDYGTDQVHPQQIAIRAEIDLHFECKDGQHNAWLCRLFDTDGKHVSAGTGNTAAAALDSAMRPFLDVAPASQSRSHRPIPL